MKAGNTDINIGTKVKIIPSNKDTDNDKDTVNGLTGKITHAFPGLMHPDVEYVAGVYLDQKGVFVDDIMNITSTDKIEII